MFAVSKTDVTYFRRALFLQSDRYPSCILIYINLTGPKIPLGDACIAAIDVCADANAVCLNGRCECKEEYHQEGGICCKFCFIFLTRKVLNFPHLT